jgi:hypothetical protein
MNEWDKPSEALKRIASNRVTEQMRKCVNCRHRHLTDHGHCSARLSSETFCECKREVLE